MKGSTALENSFQVIEVEMLPLNLTTKISFEVKIKGMRPKIVEEEMRLIVLKSLEELGIQTVPELMEKRYNLAEKIKERIVAKFRYNLSSEVSELKVKVVNIAIP